MELKSVLEIIGGYVIALGIAYVSMLIFGFNDYLKMFIYVTFLCGVIVFFKISSEKRPTKNKIIKNNKNNIHIYLNNNCLSFAP